MTYNLPGYKLFVIKLEILLAEIIMHGEELVCGLMMDLNTTKLRNYPFLSSALK